MAGACLKTEGGRFERPKARWTFPVFETGAISHSANPRLLRSAGGRRKRLGGSFGRRILGNRERGFIMARVHDVAAYILGERGSMTTWKLQKLVYYSQAWSLVWDDKPLFQARIEAWANGPVVPVLYSHHRGAYQISHWPNGSRSGLTTKERETVDAVVNFYGPKTSQWLSDLTHLEAPWINARKGLAPGERGNVEITPAAMLEYYSSL